MAGQQVGHITTDGCHHPGALQVEFGLGQGSLCQLHIGLGQPQVGLVAEQLRLSDSHVGIGLLPLLTGDGEPLFEATPAPLFTLALFELRLAGNNCSLRLAHCGLGHFNRASCVLDCQGIARRVDLQ